jgi:DNA (cytosine-5)-methyltransferase 1
MRSAGAFRSSCQDISTAGKGAGIEGERSGLWSEYARLISEIRPRVVIVENVAALLARGLGRVLGDLAALGYDAEWDCIPASAVGAPHRRDRIWIVADADGFGHVSWEEQNEGGFSALSGNRPGDGLRDVANADSQPTRRFAISWRECSQWLPEPDVGRVAHGIPSRVDRLRGLGNAVVPQIPQLIGRAISASLFPEVT